MERANIVVGVLGGMGPAATHAFFGMLIEEADAKKDQEHFRIVVDCNPKIPDRTDFLIGDGPSPLPKLRDTAKNVEDLGADILAIPCNTSHAFIEEISDSVNIEVLNMIELVVDSIERNHEDVRRVGLVATDGTINSRVYQDQMRESKFQLVLPDNQLQDSIMEAIYGDRGIKAGYYDEPREALIEAISCFDNVDAVIAGCTEISVVLSNGDIEAKVIDPLTILASTVAERVRRS